MFFCKNFNTELVQIEPDSLEDGKTKSFNCGSEFKISMAPGDSGTLCSLFVFVRLAGIIQISLSISLHSALTTSPTRAQVRIRNFRALALTKSTFDMSLQKKGISV